MTAVSQTARLMRLRTPQCQGHAHIVRETLTRERHYNVMCCALTLSAL